MAESGKPEQVILLVDNNPDEAVLIRRAFERASRRLRIESVASGSEALAYLKGETPFTDRSKHPLPDLVLLDTKMRAVNGFDVLRWIRRQPALAALCVIMLTAADEIRDVNLAHRLGATSSLAKPQHYRDAAELSRSVDSFLFRQKH